MQLKQPTQLQQEQIQEKKPFNIYDSPIEEEMVEIKQIQDPPRLLW